MELCELIQELSKIDMAAKAMSASVEKLIDGYASAISENAECDTDMLGKVETFVDEIVQTGIEDFIALQSGFLVKYPKYVARVAEKSPNFKKDLTEYLVSDDFKRYIKSDDVKRLAKLNLEIFKNKLNTKESYDTYSELFGLKENKGPFDIGKIKKIIDKTSDEEYCKSVLNKDKTDWERFENELREKLNATVFNNKDGLLALVREQLNKENKL